MDIVFSVNNMQEVLTLPIIPSEGIEIERSQKNEEFETISHGTLILLGTSGPRTFSLKSFFPMKYYRFAKNQKKGTDCVAWFEKWINQRVPFRIIITDNRGNEVLNMPCLIENFRHAPDRAGDIQYSMEIKEFVFVKVT